VDYSRAQESTQGVNSSNQDGMRLIVLPDWNISKSTGTVELALKRSSSGVNVCAGKELKLVSHADD
jgi:hypothetical protein